MSNSDDTSSCAGTVIFVFCIFLFDVIHETRIQRNELLSQRVRSSDTVRRGFSCFNGKGRNPTIVDGQMRQKCYWNSIASISFLGSSLFFSVLSQTQNGWRPYQNRGIERFTTMMTGQGQTWRRCQALSHTSLCSENLHLPNLVKWHGSLLVRLFIFSLSIDHSTMIYSASYLW